MKDQIKYKFKVWHKGLRLLYMRGCDFKNVTLVQTERSLRPCLYVIKLISRFKDGVSTNAIKLNTNLVFLKCT